LVYSGGGVLQLSRSTFGAVAQLIERVVRNDEVVGLIPICSTNFSPIAGEKLPFEASVQEGIASVNDARLLA
jgi:hypothetical protein